MAQPCANCDREAEWELNMPVDWVDYLREERDYTPVGSLRIPLCRECYPEMDQLKNATMDIVYDDDERREKLLADIHSALDELKLSRLKDTAF